MSIHLGGDATDFWWGGQVTEIWWGGEKVWAKARTVIAIATGISRNWTDVSGDTEILTIENSYLKFSIPVTCDLDVQIGVTTYPAGDTLPTDSNVTCLSGNRDLPHTFTEII